MISNVVRARIFQDFIQGASLKKLSNQYGVSIRTLERWSARDIWCYHRSCYFRDHCEEMLKRRPALLERDGDLEDKLFKYFFQASSEFEAFTQGIIPRRHMKFNLRDTLRIAKSIVEVRDGMSKRSDRRNPSGWPLPSTRSSEETG